MRSEPPADGDAVRVFLGLVPPAPVGAELARRLDACRAAPGADRVSWVSPGHFHATLVFLGEIDGPTLGATQRVLRAVAPTLAPAPVALAAVAWWPQPERPRVLVTVLGDPAGRLAAMRARLARACAPLGYRPGRTEFRPHVTLGRVRADAGPLPAVFPGLAPEPVAWTADRVSLFVGVREAGALRYQVVDTRMTGRGDPRA